MRSPRFIVGVDGSEASRAAGHFAAELAGVSNALVRAVFVRRVPATASIAAASAVGGMVDVVTILDEQEAAARAVIDRTIAGTVGYWDTQTRDGADIADVLETAARDWAADLIIVGHQGAHGVRRLFGSVGARLVRHASLPVLVVPMQATEGAETH